MAPVTALPAQYAKFLTALGGEAIAYVQLYGTTWHLEPALVMIGAALAVFGVPNAPKPALAPLPVYSDTGVSIHHPGAAAPTHREPDMRRAHDWPSMRAAIATPTRVLRGSFAPH